MVAEHLLTFLNKPVEDFSPATGISDSEKIVYRIRIDYDEAESGASIIDKIAEFAAAPGAGKVKELIIGAYDFQSSETTEDIVNALVGLKETFKELKALFIGDIIVEECEISWIKQSDISPILKAYPNLEHLQVRGGDGLAFSDCQHDHLKTLIIETGGLPPNVVKEVSAAHLPNLERLDLWLGSDNYGFESKIEDFFPILDGKKLPKLTHLGLMDSEIQDEIATAVCIAPILQQLKVLDLSMGTLTDKGAAALLASDAIRKLDFLNLRRHYMSDEMINQMKTLGIRVNVDDQEKAEDEDYRYAEVTE